MPSSLFPASVSINCNHVEDVLFSCNTDIQPVLDEVVVLDEIVGYCEIVKDYLVYRCYLSEVVESGRTRY